MRMRKQSTMQCALLRFWVPLLLLASFSYAPSVLATTEISGNEVNMDGKVVNEELAKPNLKGQDEEEKFKGFFPKPIPIVKPIPKLIPVIKPIPKPFPVVKPIRIPVYKPIPKSIPIVKRIPNGKPIPTDEAKFKGFFPKPIPIPIVKPIPVVKPIPKSIPIVKPIPKPIPILKPIPIFKPIPKPISTVKPLPKPFIVQKPIPAVEPEEFLKPKPFFKKPIPKLRLDPKFKKPLLPPLPVHKAILTP